MSWKRRDFTRRYAQLPPTKIWLNRYRSDQVHYYKISERHVRFVKNKLGANKRIRIRTYLRHLQYADCPDDVNIQQCHNRWHQSGSWTIRNTYPGPKNRMVQEATIKDSDTWCQLHTAEGSIGVIWCHHDVIWHHCEYHNIITTLDNCPCTALHIRNDILWWACVLYICLIIKSVLSCVELMIFLTT